MARIQIRIAARNAHPTLSLQRGRTAWYGSGIYPSGYGHGDVVPSEELRSFLLRMYDAWATGDFEALREMFSPDAHILLIGTDPGEWWTGRDGLEVFILQTHELGGVRFEASQPTAYCVGNVGWVADQPLFTPGNGVAVRMRLTAVLAIERGHWRFVQWHVSIGQANEASLGRLLTEHRQDRAQCPR